MGSIWAVNSGSLRSLALYFIIVNGKLTEFLFGATTENDTRASRISDGKGVGVLTRD